jgi:hypothetical protein
LKISCFELHGVRCLRGMFNREVQRIAEQAGIADE